MRRIDRAAELMHEFGHCEPMLVLARGFIEIEPQDERDRLLRDAIGWALNQLLEMAALLAAHQVVPPPRRYREKVTALRDEILQQLETTSWCPYCAAEQAQQKPDLRVIPGGG